MENIKQIGKSTNGKIPTPKKLRKIAVRKISYYTIKGIAFRKISH